MIQPLLPLSDCFWLKDLHFLSILLNLSYIPASPLVSHRQQTDCYSLIVWLFSKNKEMLGELVGPVFFILKKYFFKNGTEWI